MDAFFCPVGALIGGGSTVLPGEGFHCIQNGLH